MKKGSIQAKTNPPFFNCLSNNKTLQIIVPGLFVLFFFIVYLLIVKSTQVTNEYDLQLSLKSEVNAIKVKENDLKIHQSRLAKSKSSIEKEIKALSESNNSIKNEINSENSIVMAKQIKMNDQRQKVQIATSQIQYEEQLLVLRKDINVLQISITALSNKIKEIKSNENENSPPSIIEPLLLNSNAVRILCLWIGHPQKTLRLLYSSSRDTFKDKAFHSKCDYISPTITVVQMDNDLLIGGYTEASWDGEGFKADPNAFIFNLSCKEIYRVKNQIHSIYTGPSFFPLFGVADLYIKKGLSSSYYPNSYSVLDDNKLKINSLTQDKELFSIKELQVFQVIINS